MYHNGSLRLGQSHILLLTLSTFFLLLCSSRSDAASSSSSSAAYKNYTVGDSLGWFDTLENPEVDYQKWAASKTFSLGDFLIFNTDSNHSVIQTNNFTAYQSCDYDNAPDNNETIQWSSADPSSTSPQPVSVPVPLLKVGPTYFFSGDYDGEQCQNGQHFAINVTYGNGLPPSLKGDAMAPANPDANNEDSAPDTLVPSYFDTPQNVSDDGGSNNDASKSSITRIPGSFSGVKIFGVLMVMGVYGTI
ncbi:OLC1v1005225C1 [Oldenlandia corymbosa var. corymbosa]|uniref:OLC1v1005225C1 n=1 Tax=Oldenlandia corymbosa var. corymbosa TaxID=529605 RepID=A0AAV1DE56_OLDCO|nr:OLC1v1005225C1 [Oldenlandia corymbosa var. corymbosa]